MPAAIRTEAPLTDCGRPCRSHGRHPPVRPSHRSAAATCHIRARPGSGRRLRPDRIRAGLTFHQPAAPNMTRLDGPCDPGNPLAAPTAGHKFPGSHGPSEQRVNVIKVNLSLLPVTAIPTEVSPHARGLAALTARAMHRCADWIVTVSPRRKATGRAGRGDSNRGRSRCSLRGCSDRTRDDRCARWIATVWPRRGASGMAFELRRSSISLLRSQRLSLIAPPRRGGV
jgi:hypothetical protein